MDEDRAVNPEEPPAARRRYPEKAVEEAPAQGLVDESDPDPPEPSEPA